MVMTLPKMILRLKQASLVLAVMAMVIPVLAVPVLVIPVKSAVARDYIMRDHIVLDLRFGVEWLRCSVGQVWDGKTCSGEIEELNHEEIEKAIVLANEQLGGNWRLPTLEELEALVCMTCQGVKIDRKAFPNTDKSPYWTSEVNALAPRHVWSVNFFTGHSYARFFPNQQLAVRLVRDRR